MWTIKEPESEGDSFYFVVEPDDILKYPADPNLADYYEMKRVAFRRQDTSKYNFTKWRSLPSLRMMKKQPDLSGTIYTKSAELKNGLFLETQLEYCKENKDTSRHCVIRMADALVKYKDQKVNTSCLNIIHYYKNTVKLFFRASDMKNELLIDLLTLKEFFFDPVFDNEKYEIHVMASTAQNIIQIEDLIYD